MTTSVSPPQRRLLVVDDESMTQRLVGFMLKSLNIEVVGAGEGAEALQLAAEGNIGMILVDLNLPDMDGLTLIERLRALPSLADVPIFTFTARNHRDDERRAREVGAAGFLYKPFTTTDLRTLVSRQMKLD